jgi:hypothetical protein
MRFRPEAARRALVLSLLAAPPAAAQTPPSGTSAPSPAPSVVDASATSAPEAAPADPPVAQNTNTPASPSDAKIPPSADRDPELAAALAKDAAASAPPPASPASADASAVAGRPSSMNPDLSLILDVAGAYFSKDRFETGAHDPDQTGFNLQQLELHAGANVDPYFRLDGNVVFRTDGIDLEEAYGTTLGLPLGLQARFGQFLHRFGRINPTHPHSWDFVDQPLAIGRVFGSEGGRGLGAELSWLTPLPWYVEVVGTALHATGASTARSFYGSEDPGVSSLKDLLYVTALKQFFPLSDDWSLSWGLSGAFGPNSTGPGNRTNVFGTDVYVKYRPITHGSFTIVSLQSEWLYRLRDVPDMRLQDVSSYTQLFYRFAERWGVAARHDYGSAAFTSGGSPVVDPLDPEWDQARHRLGANVTFWPTEFSRLRLQASRDISGSPGDGWAVFLAVELVAGAHGAHAF